MTARAEGEGIVASLLRQTAARIALVFLLSTGLVALLAPLLANDEPLIVRDPDGFRFPAIQPGYQDLAGAEWMVRAPIPWGPDSIRLNERLLPPGRGHWLGTDELGRDLLARMVFGARVSLLIGLVVASLSLLLGATLGALAGYLGGLVDWIISRLIEVVLCFPFLFLLLAILAFFPPSLGVIIAALALTSWTSEARFVRGEVLRVREMEFAQAARAIGASPPRIVVRHLLPHALAPALVSATFGVASAILMESALSFLGFGVRPPQSSWGSILSAADDYLTVAWWLALFPGLAIFVTVSACNAVGEGLRKAIQPPALDRR